MDLRVQRVRSRQWSHAAKVASSRLRCPFVQCSQSRSTRWSVLMLIAVCLFANLVPLQPASAAVTPEQREQLGTLRKSLSSASRYFRGRKFDESAELVAKALGLISALESSDEEGELSRSLRAMKATAEGLVKRLKANGVELPNDSTGDNAVSFVSDVAPVLMRRCGNCHVARSRGDFSMRTFETLVAADVLQPGDGNASRLVELIREGEMPKGGGRVADDELAKLVAWIDAGAKYDGEDPKTLLTDFAQPGQPMRVELQMADGDEAFQFTRDIAPIIVESCFPCHAGTQPSARLSLATFRGLLRGGNNGPVVAPDDVAMSLILRKLRGMEGQQMPLRRPALDAKVIARIETWISEGAKFDGRDANQPLERMVRIEVASRMSHDELAKQRLELTQDNWRLVKPSEQPEQIATDALRLIGNIDAGRMQQLAQVAQQQLDAIAKLMRRPSDQPLIKGSATLYVFRRRYDYSELGRMVEKRELSPDWTGHWTYDVIDAYVCLLLPRGDEAPLDARVAELLGGLYVESRGIVPTWFSEGSSRAIAAQVAARSDDVIGWIQELKDLQATIEKPDALLDSSLPDVESKVLRFGFVQFLMSDMGRYLRLLDAVAEGTNFDTALKSTYGRDAPALVELWVKRGGRRR